jgi:hypothetical protein
MNPEENVLQQTICSILDTYQKGTELQLDLMRMTCLGLDGGNTTAVQELRPSRLTGEDSDIEIGQRAHRLLARLYEQPRITPDPIVPGFEPALTDLRVIGT